MTSAQMSFGGDPTRIRCQRCRSMLAEIECGDAEVMVICKCWQTRGLPADTGGKVQRQGVPGGAIAKAAAKIMAGKANEQHKIILYHLLQAGDRGLTQPQIGLSEGVDDRAHRTRRRELAEAGLCRYNGARRRTTYTNAQGDLVRGSNAGVVVLTASGVDEARRWAVEVER